jgi:hypothetical protein
MSKKTFYTLLLIGIYSFILVSCNRHIGEATTNNVVVFPSPPDTTRIQFLTKFSSSIDIVRKQSAFKRYVFGEEKENAIAKPYGIEIRNGKIYISDTGIQGLEVIDLEKHSFNFFIPTGLGQLKSVINSCLDDNENLYIADGGRNQIVIFDKTGKYLNAFGETENFRPTDVSVFDNKIFVVNIKGNKINVYKNDSTYKFLYSFPEAAQGDESYLYSPVNMDIKNNKVYVTDIGGYNVKAYTLEGEFISSAGSYGNNPGQFYRPKGVAVDNDENIYVVDAMYELVEMFNSKGQFLMHFGGHYQGPGYMYMPANITIDYNNLQYFEKYVDSRFKLKYLIFVTNQFGPDKITVYGGVELK